MQNARSRCATVVVPVAPGALFADQAFVADGAAPYAPVEIELVVEI